MSSHENSSIDHFKRERTCKKISEEIDHFFFAIFLRHIILTICVKKFYVILRIYIRMYILRIIDREKTKANCIIVRCYVFR